MTYSMQLVKWICSTLLAQLVLGSDLIAQGRLLCEVPPRRAKLCPICACPRETLESLDCIRG